ncbi:MAG: Hsp20/alpha crystallin family protein [Archangium sp.]|nr:Hsp20/alpha crystallin family protein [Archangium sp.]
MAELAIRKTNGGQQRQPGQQSPMNLLREMMKWDPFSEMAPVLGLQPGEGIVASFDVKETPNAYIFKADIPGFTEKDLDITTAGNRLTISGNRRDEREDKGDTYYVCERRYGSFSRAFTLPQGVDVEHVNAEVKHGVLTVTVPRVAAPAAKKIQVKSASVKA